MVLHNFNSLCSTKRLMLCQWMQGCPALHREGAGGRGVKNHQIQNIKQIPGLIGVIVARGGGGMLRIGPSL